MLYFLLLTVSLFTHCELTQNFLKFPWGVNFKFNGVLHHSIDRMWVVAKIPIPILRDVTLPSLRTRDVCKPWSEDEDKLSHNDQKMTQGLRSLCESALGHINRIAVKERYYQAKVVQLMNEELPILLPALKKGMVYHGLQETRKKGTRRWGNSRTKRHPVVAMVAPLVGKLSVIIWEQIASHLKRKRERAIINAMTAMTNRNQAMHNKLQQFHKEFTMYGQYNVDSLEKVWTTIRGMKDAYANMAYHIHDYSVAEIFRMGNRQLMYAFQLSEYIQAMEEKHGAMYRELITSLEEMLKGIATLSRGYLPVELFPPSRLTEMVNSVKLVLAKDFPDFQVALDQLHDFYDMKLVTFAVDDSRNLVVTFPVLIKHKARNRLSLYELETVPVPVQDQNEELTTYTQAILPKPYIAVAADTYIELRIQELRMCKYIHFQYYCEELFLVKDKTQFSCASALFHDLPLPTIMANCEFAVLYNSTVIPAVLDGGTSLILANIEAQKDLECDTNFPLSMALPQHSYVMLNRSVLCFCDINAGVAFVRQSLSACISNQAYMGPSVPVFHFTFNYAFFGAFAPLLTNLSFEAPRLPLVTEEEPEFPLFLPNLDELTQDPELTLTKMKEVLSKSDSSFGAAPEQDELIPLEEHIFDSYPMKLFKGIMALVSLATIVMMAWLAFKHAKLKEFVGGLTLGNLPVAMSGSDQGGMEDVLPTKLVCQDPWVTIVLTTITLIGMTLLLIREIKNYVVLHGYLYSNTCEITLFVSHAAHYVPIRLLQTTGTMHLFTTHGLDPIQIELNKGCLKDTLTIIWGDNKVAYRDNLLPLPLKVEVPFGLRIALRDIMSAGQKPELALMVKQNKQWCVIPLPARICET